MAAKKKNTPDKPVVSRVPLPLSDSALVIDLPDGQKLVIGKMGQGTVIEVATWRGVGRPDSRTSRMMFGMSSAEIEEDKSSALASDSASHSGGLISKILNYPLVLIRWLFNIQHVPKPKKNKDGSKKLIIQSNGDQANQGSTGVKRSLILAVKKLGAKALPLASKIFSAGRKQIMMVLNKEAPAKAAKQELLSSDMNIEKWLDSLTTTAKKNEIATHSSASNGVKKKK